MRAGEEGTFWPEGSSRGVIAGMALPPAALVPILASPHSLRGHALWGSSDNRGSGPGGYREPGVQEHRDKAEVEEMGPYQPTAMPQATRANLLWYQGRSWSRGLTRPPQTAFPQVSRGSSPAHCTRLSGVCSASALLPSRETGRGPSRLALPTFTVPAPQVSHCGKPAGCQSSSVTWRALEDSPQTVTSQAHTLTSRPAVPCTAGDEEPLRTSEDDHRTPKLLAVPFPRRSLHIGWQVSLECSEGDRPAADSRSGNGFHTGNG